MATAETLYTRDDIIKRSLRIVGGLGQGETPSSAQVSEAAVALNNLVKYLNTKGIMLWKREEITVTPVADQETYVIGPGLAVDQNRPLKVYSVDRYNPTTGLTIALMGLSESDYSSVSTSNTSSTPSQYWFEPLRTSGKLHLFPKPSASFVAAENIRVYYQAPITDFADASANPDIPLELYDLLVFGLADRLTFEYGVERFLRKEIRESFREQLEDALDFINEDDPIFFQVDRGF